MANVYRLGEVLLDDLQFEQREYKAGEAYAQSKLAVLLFTRKLCRQLEGTLCENSAFLSVWIEFQLWVLAAGIII